MGKYEKVVSKLRLMKFNLLIRYFVKIQCGEPGINSMNDILSLTVHECLRYSTDMNVRHKESGIGDPSYEEQNH